MVNSKFKVGDIITALDIGFTDVEIFKIDTEYYHCKIPNGTVTIPIKVVEERYKLSSLK